MLRTCQYDITFLRISVLILVLCCAISGFAQQGKEQYLLTSQLNVIDAKSVARGGVNIASLNPNVTDVLQNPARLSDTLSHDVAINYSPFPSVYNAFYFAYAYQNPKVKWKNFSVGLKVFDLGPLNTFDATGIALGEKPLQDYNLSFGTGLGHVRQSPLRIGIQMHWLTSYWINDWATAITFDVGAFFQTPKKDINIGLVMSSIGFGLRNFDNNSTPITLPIEINLESVFAFEHAPLLLKFALVDLADLGTTNKTFTGLGNENSSDNNIITSLAQHVVIGIDFIPKKILHLHLHLSYGFRQKAFRFEDGSGLAGLGLGGTITTRTVALSYGKQFFGNFGTTNHISLAYKI